MAIFLMLGARAQEEVTVKTFKELASDLSARTNRRYDLNDEPCALVKVMYPKPGATFEGNIVGEAEFRQNEYWVYVATGTKRFRIHLPEIPTIVLEASDYGFDRLQSNVTYVVEFKFPSKKGMSGSFYAGVGFTAGSTMGPELSLGTYLGGFNIELNAMLPLGGGADVYWNNPANPSVKCTYKPTFSVGGRLGYGIKLGEAIRLTPQVGMMFMKTSESVEGGQYDAFAKGAYCSSLAIDLKAQYFFAKNLAVSLVPEYDLPVMKSEGFKVLSTASSKIKKWGNGINVKIGLSYEF